MAHLRLVTVIVLRHRYHAYLIQMAYSLYQPFDILPNKNNLNMQCFQSLIQFAFESRSFFFAH